MSDVIDVRGEPCPVPVIRTRKAMESILKPGQDSHVNLLTVLVSKQDQVDNVTRMAGRSGWTSTFSQQGDHFRIDLTGPESQSAPVIVASEDLTCEIPVSGRTSRVTVVASNTMGKGSETLGGVLIRAFLGVLKELDSCPEIIIFYNSGVKLVIEGSPVLAEIRELDELGVELLVCGTCLEYFEIRDKVCVGTVSNMYDIATAMLDAENAVVL